MFFLQCLSFQPQPFHESTSHFYFDVIRYMMDIIHTRFAAAFKFESSPIGKIPGSGFFFTSVQTGGQSLPTVAYWDFGTALPSASQNH